jgi:hypothetical protein
MDDDGILLWLNDRTTTATNFVTSFLNGYNSGAKVNGATVPDAIGSDINGNQISKSFTHAGIAKFYAGSAAATYMGVDYSKDQRVPDIIGIAQTGSVYGGSKLSKIAEHGGGLSNDRHVPIVISGAGIFHVSPITQPVKTIQIAPTILHLLGLEPRELQAVVLENTPVLPGL